MGSVGNMLNSAGGDLSMENNLKVLEQNDQIMELQTIIRDKWGYILSYSDNKN